MFCPNCGKDCGSAKFCTRCGNNLHTDHTIGVYKCTTATFELTPNAVIICKSFPRSSRVVVPYGQIRFVTYMPRAKTQRSGFLSIYTYQSKGAIVTNSYQALHDSMSIIYDWRFNENSFLTLFWFLCECVSENRKRFWENNGVCDEVYAELGYPFMLSYQRVCPNCASTKITCTEPEYNDFRLGVSRRSCLIFCASANREKKKKCVCMKCGYVWYQK